MRIKIYFAIVLLFLSFGLVSDVWPQEELVKGYYDLENDWFVFEFTSPVEGFKKSIYDSANKVEPLVKAYVKWDEKTTEYIYGFEVSNGNKAKQLLDSITIKFSSSIYDQTAPSKDWYMSEHRAGRTDTWQWSKTRGEPSGIPPGEMSKGFFFKSKGLPAIVDMFFWGERRKRYSPPSADDPDALHESFSRVLDNLKVQYPHVKKTITRKTIGPKTPPAPFVPIDFLNYIISLKHEAYSLGWIVQGRDDDKGKKEDEEKGIVKSLDKKLEKAKEELVKGDNREAIEKLNSFIHEVKALYKEDKEGKHEKEKEGHSHITSEAYALLKYNTVYLIEKLGGEWKDKNDKKD